LSANDLGSAMGTHQQSSTIDFAVNAQGLSMDRQH
jgi:hypothetical protein